MTVGLFIPCYVDQFYPRVAIATLELIEKCGIKIDYPTNQTCCGQPMANSGCEQNGVDTYKHFVKTFSAYDYIVCPSGSCVYHIQKHFNIIEQTPEVKHIRARTFELVQFLTQILKLEKINASFPYQVGLHLSCHAQRGLHQSTSSEYTPDRQGDPLTLLKTIRQIKITELERNDECCGFGGTFCVTEEAVSSRMGIDRISDHIKNGTQVLTGGDMSCLMHLEGLIKRQQLPIHVMHIAEIFNGSTP